MIMTGQSGGVYEPGNVDKPQRHCFAVLVANEPGILARIAGLFSGRGYNIESLTVDEVDHAAHFSRISIVTSGPRKMIDQIERQLARLIPVRRVVNLTEQGRFVESCVAFVKLVASDGARAEGKMIARRYGARVADETGNAIVFEVSSERSKIDQLVAELRTHGEIEVARTGSLAMGCGEAMLSAPAHEVERRSA